MSNKQLMTIGYLQTMFAAAPLYLSDMVASSAGLKIACSAGVVTGVATTVRGIFNTLSSPASKAEIKSKHSMLDGIMNVVPLVYGSTAMGLGLSSLYYHAANTGLSNPDSVIVSAGLATMGAGTIAACLKEIPNVKSPVPRTP